MKRQRRQAGIWIKELECENDIQVINRNEITPNYWVFGTLVRDKRKTIINFRNKGWYASGVHINNNVYSIFGKQDELPGVNEFYAHYVALPCGWWVDKGENIG